MLTTGRTVQILIDATPYRFEDISPEDADEAFDRVRNIVEDTVSERVDAFVAVHTGDYGEDQVQVIGEDDVQAEIEFGQFVVRTIEDAVNAVAEEFEPIW